MKIEVKVIANASKNTVKKEADILKIYVTAQREKGKANKQVIKLLAQYFAVNKSSIEIIKGERSGKKTILIENIK